MTTILKFRKSDIPVELQRAVKSIRDKWAEKGEFTREQIVPEVMEEVNLHLSKVDIPGYFTRKLIQDAEHKEAAEKKTEDGFFSYDRIIALGDGASCKTGKLNSDRILRRKRVIDNNQIAQQKAWSEETEDLDNKFDALKGYPKKTVISDIQNEDGSPVEYKSKSKKRR